MGAKCNFNIDGSRNAAVMKMRQNKSMAATAAEDMAKIQIAAGEAEARKAAAAAAAAAAAGAEAGAEAEAAGAATAGGVSAMEVEPNPLESPNVSEQTTPVPPVPVAPVVDVPAQLGQVSVGGWVQLSEDGADQAPSASPSSSSSSSSTTASDDAKAAAAGEVKREGTDAAHGARESVGAGGGEGGGEVDVGVGSAMEVEPIEPTTSLTPVPVKEEEQVAKKNEKEAVKEVKAEVNEEESVTKVKSEEGPLADEQDNGVKDNGKAKADNTAAADSGYNGYDDGQDRYDSVLHLPTYLPSYQ